MLCGCLEPLVGPAPGNGKHGDGFGGSYPGRRNEGQFVPTGGNALAAFDPNAHGNATGMGQLVAVTVPPGISPGQTLRVASPDGSGRLVEAVVPAGAFPGSSFMVQFPSNLGYTVDSSGSLPLDQQPVTAAAGVTAAEQNLPTAFAVPLPANGKTSPPPSAAQGGYNDVAILQPPATPPPSSLVPPPGEKLIMVEVPPGTSAGTPMHVQIPGEGGRTIMATVPPGNVKQFHVSYKPSEQLQPKHKTAQQPPGAPTMPFNRATSTQRDQKHLLVQVPPGVAPGATLHVQVPEENRVVAVTVPPNVQSFHVAYTPQQQGGNASSSQRMQQQQRPQTGCVNSFGSNMNNGGHDHHNKGGGGMIGSMAPAVAGAAGAALMGAAAYSMFHHSSCGGDYSDNNVQYVDDGPNAYGESNQQPQVADDSGGGADFDVADY